MYYLTEAFSAAASMARAAANFQDQIGCFMMRAMTDSAFLTPSTQFIESRNMQGAADIYQWAVGRGQNWLINTLQENGQNGGVKPDFKRGFIDIVRPALPFLARVNWTSPAVLVTAFAAAAIATAYTLGTGHHHHGADLIGSLYSSTQRGPQLGKT